jgi:Phytanoyl-CoA dioxygenase (PhyH)
MRPVFTDERLERQLTELGYVVVDMLDRDGVAELAELHAATCDGDPAGLDFTTQYPAGGAKDAIREGLLRAYRRDLAGQMHPQEVVVAAFITKGRSGDSTIPVHLDWAIVDEARDRSVNVWIPLCDVDESNGALAMLPGSHRLPLTRRGTDTAPALAAPPELMQERMTLVPMRAGQAVIYDHRTIHGSAANTSGERRVAAVMSLVPAGTTLVHYLGGGDGELRELQVDAGFFHAYVVDPDSDRGPNVDALIAGRPSRSVPATAPITADDVRALSRL